VSAETIDLEYELYLALWLAAPVLLFMLYTRRGTPGGFLVYTYLISIITSHWFGALAHASPWSHFVDSSETVVGFRYSSYALIAFVAGTMLTEKFRQVRSPRPQDFLEITDQQSKLVELERIALRFFLPIGLGSWIATFTPLASLPSADAALSVGKGCLLLGVCLMSWSAWHLGQKRRLTILLLLSGILPVVTVVTSGFIGYGIAMVTTVLAFVAMFYRPRWRLLVGLVLILYGGVSLWVTYAEYRDTIRTSVWGGEAAATSFDKLVTMLSDFRPFDLANPDHLESVDSRLNQNMLVGAAVHTTPALVPFRNGETVYAAMAAVVPRALWPDKPTVGGSGTYVSEHTLIRFAEGTSVGMGQVFEFYINFGTAGIVVGFILVGALLRYMDIRLVEALIRNDWPTVMYVFLIGSGLLLSGGSLAEMAACAAAGWVCAWGLLRVLSFIARRNRVAF
jgi:hypothetical protein